MGRSAARSSSSVGKFSPLITFTGTQASSLQLAHALVKDIKVDLKGPL